MLMMLLTTSLSLLNFGKYSFSIIEQRLVLFSFDGLLTSFSWICSLCDCPQREFAPRPQPLATSNWCAFAINPNGTKLLNIITSFVSANEKSKLLISTPPNVRVANRLCRGLESVELREDFGKGLNMKMSPERAFPQQKNLIGMIRIDRWFEKQFERGHWTCDLAETKYQRVALDERSFHAQLYRHWKLKSFEMAEEWIRFVRTGGFWNGPGEYGVADYEESQGLWIILDNCVV